MLLVDNPVVSTLAAAGVLTDHRRIRSSTPSAIQPNLLGAGVVDGKTYGVPIGANTLALYYNKNVLRQGRRRPVLDHQTGRRLTAALAKVKAAGKKGITFSAIGTEEGSFQFLPWFWGAGANLTKLDSPQGVGGAELWTELAQGRATRRTRCIQNTQTTSWQEFATGDYALRRERHLAAGQREEGRLRLRDHPDPGRDRRHRARPDRR